MTLAQHVAAWALGMALIGLGIGVVHGLRVRWDGFMRFVAGAVITFGICAFAYVVGMAVLFWLELVRL